MKRCCILPAFALIASCGDSESPSTWSYQSPPQDASVDADDADAAPADAEAEAHADATVESGDAEGGPTLTSCDFDYDQTFVYTVQVPGSSSMQGTDTIEGHEASEDGAIVHAEPPPPYTWKLGGWRDTNPEDLVMPGYDDDMPLFERAGPWTEPTRCFETPVGVRLLTEEEAYDMYRSIAEKTTGVAMNTAMGVRSVVGLRGTYPGRFAWHGNNPNRFDDTLVLLWIDQEGARRVREFPVNTDTGSYDFGYHNSSSLRPNRRYRYINGWHRDYNALRIHETDYRVRDDGNKNGHWDSDRNGWLPPVGSDDHDRNGSAHNIHMGSVSAPLGTAVVGVWSAGCQVIPGMANWTAFITKAWTNMGDEVDYFLIDTRDIPSDVWAPCTPDGSHECPYRIDSLPFSDSRDTSTQGTDVFSKYNCSDADESGPEIVYVLNIDEVGTLRVSVDCEEPVDIDVHLLDGDDPNACLARGHISFEYAITPGRYLIIADTFVDGATVHSGPYTIHVSLD